MPSPGRPRALNAIWGLVTVIDSMMTPIQRYIRCVVVRGVSNAVVDSVIADLHHYGKLPVTLDPTVSKCVLAR